MTCKKINRLVHGIARIWWRHHEVLGKYASKEVLPGGNTILTKMHSKKEFKGLGLKSHLSNAEVLQQLMFSSIMLHWYIHGDGTLSLKRELDFSAWKNLNRGIDVGGVDIPDCVQRPIFDKFRETFFPQLAVASKSCGNGDAAAGVADDHGVLDECSADTASERSHSHAFLSSASIEGWTEIVGGVFPRPTGLAGVQKEAYKRTSNIFSEVTNSDAGASPFTLAGDNPSGTKVISPNMALQPQMRKDDCAWLTLCCSLLFFSTSPLASTPYAFVELQQVGIANIDTVSHGFTLVRASDKEEKAGGIATPLGVSTITTVEKAAPGSGQKPMVIVLLLPDGRWQELSLPKLQLRMRSAAEMEKWRSYIEAVGPGIHIEEGAS